jgi:LacI family transcriptional regulator
MNAARRISRSPAGQTRDGPAAEKGGPAGDGAGGTTKPAPPSGAAGSNTGNKAGGGTVGNTGDGIGGNTGDGNRGGAQASHSSTDRGTDGAKSASGDGAGGRAGGRGTSDAGAGSPVTLYDVARLAGVSIATVSRVVHGQDLVRDSTRARVREVIEQLGYVPDGAAQSLSRRRKDVVGLVCVERSIPSQYDVESMALLFYDEILRGVEAQIRSHNRSLLITYLQEARPDLSRLMSLSGKVDGLLIGEEIVPSELLARLTKRLPVVVISGSPRERSADVVTADNRSGSIALFTHLVEDHGLRRLYYVEGPPTAPDAKERSLALAEVIGAHPGCELTGSSPGFFSVQSGEEAGQSLLALPAADRPDAVVCANDQTAIGVLRALDRGDVRVPEDMAVVGFDDIYPGSLFEPSLTIVHQPMRLLGERACARLLDRIAHPGRRQKVELLPTELVLRSSCGCPPGTEIRRPVPPLLGRRRAAAARTAAS